MALYNGQFSGNRKGIIGRRNEHTLSSRDFHACASDRQCAGTADADHRTETITVKSGFFLPINLINHRFKVFASA